MTLRLVHPAQKGSRLSERDGLFETVPLVEQRAEPVEQIPVPEVCEIGWPPLIFDASEAERIAAA